MTINFQAVIIIIIIIIIMYEMFDDFVFKKIIK